MPHSPNLRFYKTIRAVGWIALGTYVVILGTTALLNQFLAFTVLIISTNLVAPRSVGDDGYTLLEGGLRRARVLDGCHGKDQRSFSATRPEII